MAHQALQIEDKIGTMLPCNVVVQATPAGDVEIAAIDPSASMIAVENESLQRAASIVGDEVKAVVAAIWRTTRSAKRDWGNALSAYRRAG